MRAAFAVLFTGAVALGAGFLGFQAGVASNLGPGGAVIVLGGGFNPFGFLFFIFLLGMIMFAIGGRRRAWRHGAMGPMGGHGPWGGPSMDDRRQWVADMHRRLHEEQAAANGATGAGSASDSGPSSPTGSGPSAA